MVTNEAARYTRIAIAIPLEACVIDPRLGFSFHSGSYRSFVREAFDPTELQLSGFLFPTRLVSSRLFQDVVVYVLVIIRRRRCTPKLADRFRSS